MALPVALVGLVGLELVPERLELVEVVELVEEVGTGRDARGLVWGLVGTGRDAEPRRRPRGPERASSRGSWGPVG